MSTRMLLLLTTALLALSIPMNVGGCPLLDGLFPPADMDPNDGDPNDPNDDMDPNDPNDDDPNDDMDPNDPNDDDPNDDDPNDDDPNDGDTEKTLHERIFTEILPDGYEGTASCVACHSNHALDLLETGHWNWEGSPTRIAGFEDGSHGKIDLINNFCIAVPTNEGRCAQCHPSYGWVAGTPDSFFENENNADCLVCHDTTGTYRKHPTAGGGGGQPALVIDGELTAVDADQLQEVAYNVGSPSRGNCGFCHFNAGGGDNVKHGDLSSAIANPSRELDVHMGGLNFSCQTCHEEMDHGISGYELHSFDEGGDSPDCTRCHGEENVHQENPAVDSLLNLHLERVACQTCHIPAFAREVPTKTEWYWSEAGEDRTDIPMMEGRATYDKKKGRFVWETDVRPVYLWYSELWNRKIVGVNDTYTEAGTVADPVIIAAPTATAATPGAKLYPFKKMIGDQVADTANQRLVVPHLFGSSDALPNPYWGKFDWDLALQDGAAYTGVEYSGEFGFVNTVMYLTVNHQIAPKENALSCNDCHFQPEFWDAIGIADPLGGN